jgi:uncharacterized protein involved in exopolysaccharide biosynthesis
MEENKKHPKVIDLRDIVKKIWDRKKLYLKVFTIVFFASSIYILGVPRYYTTDATLAPETENSSAGVALGSLASSFGFDLGGTQTSDAIYPMLYPDLLEDNGFVASLFSIQVVSNDGKIKTSYHDYLKHHQKSSWWGYPIVWVKKLFKQKKKPTKTTGKYNPYILSEEEDKIVEKVKSNLKFNYNEKTGVISIKAKAQDPLICKTLADSVMKHLQEFITEYRTNKARVDYEFYSQLTIEAKHNYEKARQRYATFADGNVNIALQSVRLKSEEMESEMELLFNNYTNLNNQLQAAKAKIQERTPAFTILKGAAVPLKPAGPKRSLFVFFMLILSAIVTTIIITRDDLIKIIEVRDKNS